MAFLDDFGKKLTKTSQSMAKKAKDVAEVSNLKLQIKDEERKMKSEFAELGERYYALHSESPQQELADGVEKVQEIKRKITILEGRIAEIENERVCPSCGIKLPEKGQFCPACGTRYPQQEEETGEEAAVEFHTCKNCGAQVMDQEAFCTKCGAKQENVSEVPPEGEIDDVVEEPVDCKAEEESAPVEEAQAETVTDEGKMAEGAGNNMQAETVNYDTESADDETK